MPAKTLDETHEEQLHADIRELLWSYGARTKGDQIRILAELIAVLGPTHKGRELYRYKPKDTNKLVINRTGKYAKQEGA